MIFGMCGEEVHRLLDRHVEHVGDRLALEAHLERLAVVALPVALLARHVHVREEVHLDLDLAVAAADLAAAALHVEREAARLVPARPRLLRARVEVADVVEEPDVGGRVRARRAPDRRLVDVDDLVDLLQPADPPVRPRALLRPVEPVRHGLVEHLVHERRLARPRHARDRAEDAERDLHVDLLEVVLRRALHLDVPRGPAALLRNRDLELPGEVLAGERVRRAEHVGGGPFGHELPAVLAGAGPEVHQVVGRPHRALVVLDHDHGVAEVAQPLERGDQALVVALVQADRRLVEDVQHAHERRPDLGGEPDALRLAARQRRGRALERQVAHAHVVEEAEPLVDLAQDQPRDRALGVRQLELLQPLDRAARRTSS